MSDFGFQRKKSILEEDNVFGNDLYPSEDENKAGHPAGNTLSDYGDDYDDYVLKRQRKLFSLQDAPLRNSSHAGQHRQKTQRRRVRDKSRRPQQESRSVLTLSPPQQMHTKGHISPKIKLNSTKRLKFRSVGTRASTPRGREKPGAKERLVNPSEQRHTEKSEKSPRTNQRAKLPQLQPSDKDLLILRKREVPPVAVKHLSPRRGTARPSVSLAPRDARQRLREREIEMNMPLQQEEEDRVHRAGTSSIDRTGPTKEDASSRPATREYLWGRGGADFEGVDDEDLTPAPVFDAEVNWSQTFQVNTVDLQALRSDWIDLHCNVSGNLLLGPSDALPVVTAFMERLNSRHPGCVCPCTAVSVLCSVCGLIHSVRRCRSFSLVRVVNVVKRVDGVLGSRYLLELELEDLSGRRLRLSRYIYVLVRHGNGRLSKPQPQLLLCNPVGFLWNASATVHFIVPGTKSSLFHR